MEINKYQVIQKLVEYDDSGKQIRMELTVKFWTKGAHSIDITTGISQENPVIFYIQSPLLVHFADPTVLYEPDVLHNIASIAEELAYAGWLDEKKK